MHVCRGVQAVTLLDRKKKRSQRICVVCIYGTCAPAPHWCLDVRCSRAPPAVQPSQQIHGPAAQMGVVQVPKSSAVALVLLHSAFVLAADSHAGSCTCRMSITQRLWSMHHDQQGTAPIGWYALQPFAVSSGQAAALLLTWAELCGHACQCTVPQRQRRHRHWRQYAHGYLRAQPAGMLSQEC